MRIITINYSTCRRCGACVKVCGPGAIAKIDDDVGVVDSNLCYGCMECIKVCPTGSIKIQNI
ncbi:MAG: 4Fe-4S ferredoxin [Thermoprotei archaeon]|mgnify:CR=1 FL=1|nr:MAG: 4Fe-4S ferredoxin [Thermoprotei archaeon]RLF21583.1 MAG: 4Fe-4S ferredoxin [Thermoprotei archaeon]